MENFFVDLNHLDLMAVTGDDSEKFLQGQLTCDIENLSDELSCLGASCDNKGRALANFRILKYKDSFLIEMQPGIMALLKPVLEKYKVFYKCTLDDAASSFYRYGLSGDKSAAFLTGLFPALPVQVNQVVSHDGMHLVMLSASPPRFELWLEPSSHDVTLETMRQELPQASTSDWEILDIQSGIFQIEVGDSGLYTPQLLNFDLAGYIDFKKGCYTGQEIVARMHYRGKARKRLYHMLINSGQNVYTGLSINEASGKKLGNVVKTRKTDAQSYESLVILESEIKYGEKLFLDDNKQSQTTLFKQHYPQDLTNKSP